MKPTNSSELTCPKIDNLLQKIKKFNPKIVPFKEKTSPSTWNKKYIDREREKSSKVPQRTFASTDLFKK